MNSYMYEVYKIHDHINNKGEWTQIKKEIKYLNVKSMFYFENS